MTPTAPRSAPLAGWRTLAPAGVLLAGAGVYGVLVGGEVLRFTTTPLLLGLLVIAAGLVGFRHRVIGTGLVLAGWGTAVILVDHAVIPGDRTAPAYMLGVGSGLLVALAVAPRAERADWLTSASVTAVTAPLSLYLASDMASLGRWRIWSALLIGWAAWEAFWGWRDQQAPAAPPSLSAV